MFENINKKMSIDIAGYFQELEQNPLGIILLILDIIAVGFLIYGFVKIAKKSRVWQF